MKVVSIILVICGLIGVWCIVAYYISLRTSRIANGTWNERVMTVSRKSTVDGHPLPLLDDSCQILGTVSFVDNLTLSHVPDYVNYNGFVGLARISGGAYEGELVIMYYDKEYPRSSYAEFITEEEAYMECWNRGKLDVAKELGIEIPIKEREVI